MNRLVWRPIQEYFDDNMSKWVLVRMYAGSHKYTPCVAKYDYDRNRWYMNDSENEFLELTVKEFIDMDDILDIEQLITLHPDSDEPAEIRYDIQSEMSVDSQILSLLLDFATIKQQNLHDMLSKFIHINDNYRQKLIYQAEALADILALEKILRTRISEESPSNHI